MVAGLLTWSSGILINGIVQRSVYRMRQQVSAKINRMPLKYFDNQPRGELLSRVTNDVDNVAQSLQQTLSQVLTNIFMLLGVLVMMFVLSPILAVVALVTIPVALGLTDGDRQAVAEAVRQDLEVDGSVEQPRSRRPTPATTW